MKSRTFWMYSDAKTGCRACAFVQAKPCERAVQPGALAGGVGVVVDIHRFQAAGRAGHLETLDDLLVAVVGGPRHRLV